MSKTFQDRLMEDTEENHTELSVVQRLKGAAAYIGEIQEKLLETGQFESSLWMPLMDDNALGRINPNMVVVEELMCIVKEQVTSFAYTMLY